MGQRSAHVAQIDLRDCRVPAENLLGEEGDAYKATMGALSRGRISIAAIAVGTARAALEAALRYAKQREAYGAPIFNLQGVSFDLADMATQVEIAHQFVLHAARLYEAGLPSSKEASMAKLFASEMAEKVCSDAVQIHGGYGYMADFPVERYLRRRPRDQDLRRHQPHPEGHHFPPSFLTRSAVGQLAMRRCKRTPRTS